jgi:hypothetical protein
MSGEQLDPARIVTHFESDYGAAPKVDMPLGQTLTNLVPDFKAERWTGLLAGIEAVPFLPICRSPANRSRRTVANWHRTVLIPA